LMKTKWPNGCGFLATASQSQKRSGSAGTNSPHKTFYSHKTLSVVTTGNGTAVCLLPSRQHAAQPHQQMNVNITF
jgi:hypothetical protein